MTIRWIIRRDIAEIMRIQDEILRFPWTEKEMVDALGSRNVIGMCSVNENDEPQGYMIYQLEKRALCILNVGVDQKFHRQGIGTELIDKLIGKLSSSASRRNRLRTELAEYNLAALQFFKAKLFQATSIKYNEDLGFSVIKMIYDIRRIKFHPHHRGVTDWLTPLKKCTD